jgi:thiol-disulfide isomerase/thioredoxin
MAALTEDEQMAQAIAASLTLNNPSSTTTTTTSTTPSAPTISATASTTSSSSSGANKTEEAVPKKKGKSKILRFIHANGLHRMTKIVFETMTMKNLKIRLVQDMKLQCEATTLVLKMNKQADFAWDATCDAMTLSELGVKKNGQKLWLEFPEPTLKPLWKGLGTQFIGPGMSNIGPERLACAKVIGIYFSAHWCGPCRQFTPQLVKTYNAMKARNCPIEILFISADRSQEDMESYFATMPWVAGQSTPDLKALAGNGIPELIFIKTDGEIITKDGRNLVARDPTGAAIMKAAGV